MFNIDEPIKGNDDDRLHRTAFASALADALNTYGRQECLVLGLYGPWGSGKSSLLNLMQHRLISLDNQFVVMNFRPWLISHRDALLSEFFQQMAKTLGKRDSSASLREIGKKLSRYGKMLTTLGSVPIPHVALSVGSAGAFLSTAGSMASQVGGRKKSLLELKDELERSLQAQDAKIVVLVDDIDRLTSTEIQQIFQLVKAVADFSNVIYVLAMDPNVVAHALRQTDAPSDDDYLSKIVQVPISVPLPSQKDMDDLLIKGIEQIIPDLTSNNWGGYPYWQRIWFEGQLRSLFRTVREVKRFLNVLELEYGVVRGEVNAEDFVAITAVKVLVPHAYQAIYYSKHELVEGPYDSNIVDAILSECPKTLQELVRPLLMQIFPLLNQHMKRSVPHLGIADPKHFDKYFTLTIPHGHVSERQFNAIVRDASARNIRTALDDLRQENTVDSFLLRLLEEAPTMDKTRAKILIPALLEQGPDFAEMGWKNDSRGLLVLRIIYQLLGCLSPVERVQVLRETIEKASGVDTLAFNIAVLGQQHGRFEGGEGLSPDERSLNEEGLHEVEHAMVHKLEGMDVFGLSQWPSLLAWWTEWDEGSERKYVHDRVSVDDLPGLVETFMSPYDIHDIPGLSLSQWARGLGVLTKVFGDLWLRDNLRKASANAANGSYPLFEKVCTSLLGSSELG